LLFNKNSTPAVSFLTIEFLNFNAFATSTVTLSFSKMIPLLLDALILSISSTFCKYVFVGIQPLFKQVPPNLLFSAIATFAPF